MDNSTYPESDEISRREKAVEAARAAARADGHPDGSLRPMSGLLLWLAKRLKTPPELLAARIPDDTIRRTKYPYIAVDEGDGTTSFKGVGVVPGKYRITAPVSPGSKRDAHRGGTEIRRIDG